MQSQTLKRHAGDVSFSNDDINDDEYDVTWGKRSRYLYTYSLQSPVLFSNSNDSESESVYSIQSKATIQVADKLNSVFETSCDSAYNKCDTSCNNQDSSQSNNSAPEVAKHLSLFCSNDGYSPAVEIDFQVTNHDTTLPTPFKTCIQCTKTNTDPRFQYCYTCFRYRKQVTDPKPKGKRTLLRYSETFKDSQGSFTSQESGSFGISGLCLSQESTDTFENEENSCNVCLVKEKNGVFNHGHTSHVYTCYSCAKKIWKKSGKCPICNLKVKYVTKAYYC